MADATLLSLVLYLPLVGIAALAAVPERNEDLMRRVSLGTMILQLLCAAYLYVRFDATIAGLQFETRFPWISDWGVYYHIGLDGMNLLLVMLTAFLGPLVVAGSFTRDSNQSQVGYA